MKNKIESLFFISIILGAFLIIGKFAIDTADFRTNLKTHLTQRGL